MAVLPAEKKEEVSKIIGSPAFAEKMAKQRPDMIDVLTELKIELNLDQFLEFAGKITPRYFTVASSNVVSPNVVSIMLRVETFKTANNDIWIGLFSDFIREKYNFGVESSSNKLRYNFQFSCFQLPTNGSGIVMIGTGTGVAPFVGIAQEKAFLASKSPIGQLALVFGCRKQNEDFIAKDCIVSLHEQDVIHDLLVGFSQEGVA